MQYDEDKVAPSKVEESNGESDTRAKCLSRTWFEWRKGEIAFRQRGEM